MINYNYALVAAQVCVFVYMWWLVLVPTYVSFTAAGKSNQKLVRCLLNAAN